MPAPGSEVVERQSSPSRSTAIQSGTWFVAGLADRGSTTEAKTVRNLQQFVDEFGEFVSYGMLYNAADVFFREGGAELKVTRVVGPAAKSATITLKNGAAENTLKVTAASPGEWANDVEVEVSAGEVEGSYIITVFEDEVEVEGSPELASNELAVAWAKEQSSYITVEDLGKGDPAAGTFELKEGADDRNNAADEHWEEAINENFPKSLGPGQVSMPGRTTDACYEAQLTHALANNRVAILDGTDSSAKATLLGDAAVGREMGITGGKGGLFGTWVVVPGIAPGTTRSVPYSCVEAGILARLASEGYSPNKAGAGEKYGQSRYAIELVQPEWSEDDHEDLNDGGVNIALMKDGVVTTMGFRTMVDPLADDTWLQLSNSRLYMEIAAKANAIADTYVFEEIDGKGLVFAKLNGELRGMLLPYWPSSLYGESFEEAAFVNTGPQVNSPQTISELQINAVIEVRMSPFGERVKIEISKVAITEAVA